MALVNHIRFDDATGGLKIVEDNIDTDTEITGYNAGTGGVTAGDYVYINSAGTVLPADPTTAKADAIGYVKTTTGAASAVTVHTTGDNVAATSASDISGSTDEGDPAYLDSSNPGQITNTPTTTTGEYNQYVGKFITVGTTTHTVATDIREPVLQP